MKKVILGMMTGVFAVSMCAATAFAAGPRCGHHGAYAGSCGVGGRCAYVDANWDGICDNCGAYRQYHMAGSGCGGHFVDADGDGVCDVCGVAHTHLGGYYFVDADGDGICDNYGLGQGGCGKGHGHRCGRGR